MNSSDMAYDRGTFLLSFIDSECCYEPEATLQDYDEAIEEYQAILDDAVLRNDTQSIRDLRRDIQRCKVEKRRFKQRLANNNIQSEVAYS